MPYALLKKKTPILGNWTSHISKQQKKKKRKETKLIYSLLFKFAFDSFTSFREIQISRYCQLK